MEKGQNNMPLKGLGVGTREVREKAGLPLPVVLRLRIIGLHPGIVTSTSPPTLMEADGRVLEDNIPFGELLCPIPLEERGSKVSSSWVATTHLVFRAIGICNVSELCIYQDEKAPIQCHGHVPAQLGVQRLEEATKGTTSQDLK